MVTHQPSSLQQSPQRKDFEGGVHLGIGGFNLVSLNLILLTLSVEEHMPIKQYVILQLTTQG